MAKSNIDAYRFNPIPSALFWVSIASLGMLAFFWDGLISLGAGWARPEYSYGPMVPLITAYIALREVHHRPIVLSSNNKLPGILMLVFGLCIGLFANLAQVPDIITYGFLIAIGGLFLILTGAREGLRFWPGWLHLFFMLPLPSMIYWKVSTELQFVSSWLGVEVIHLLNIPVFLDGNIIDLGVYKLHVAEACSGLRYMFPLLSFGWLFAVLYNGPFWHRVVLVISTVPITILMNSFRIGVIGILVHHFGIEQAEGFLHYFEGWIIFMACTLILFVEAWLLQNLLSNGKKYNRILDIDFEGIIKPLAMLPSVRSSRALIVTSTMVMICGLAWQLSPTRADTLVNRMTFAEFPMKLGEWSGSPQTLDPVIEKVLGANDYLLADFASATGKPTVNMFLSFYNSQTKGSGIHSPEVCIPSGGWEVSGWRSKVITVDGSNPVSFSVNRAIIQKGLERQLVYYWFEQRGRRFTNDYRAKFNTVLDTITRGRSDGALVRLVTPITSADGEDGADKRLSKFLEQALPKIPAFIPI